jgi:hypothetical protein
MGMGSLIIYPTFYEKKFPNPPIPTVVNNVTHNNCSIIEAIQFRTILAYF